MTIQWVNVIIHTVDLMVQRIGTSFSFSEKIHHLSGSYKRHSVRQSSLQQVRNKHKGTCSFMLTSPISIKEQDKHKGTSKISQKEHVPLRLSKISIKEQTHKIVPLCLFQLSIREQDKHKGTKFSIKSYNNRGPPLGLRDCVIDPFCCVKIA